MQEPCTCSFDAEEPIPEMDVFLYQDASFSTVDETSLVLNLFVFKCPFCSFTYQLFIDGNLAATDPVEDGADLVLNVAGSG